MTEKSGGVVEDTVKEWLKIYEYCYSPQLKMFGLTLPKRCTKVKKTKEVRGWLAVLAVDDLQGGTGGK